MHIANKVASNPEGLAFTSAYLYVPTKDAIDVLVGKKNADPARSDVLPFSPMMPSRKDVPKFSRTPMKNPCHSFVW